MGPAAARHCKAAVGCGEEVQKVGYNSPRFWQAKAVKCAPGSEESQRTFYQAIIYHGQQYVHMMYMGLYMVYKL